MAMAEVCKVCQGTTWTPGPEGRGVVRCKACEDQRRGFVGSVPMAERETRLADYDGKARQITGNLADVLKHVRLFVDGVHPDLFLHGGVGAGKTALACAALNELHRQRVHCMFVRVPELLIQLQGEGDQERFAAVCNVQALVLDDVGASQGTDFARRMLQAVYDARIDKGRRTIWTSNLDLDELTTFLESDKRLASRIAGQAKVLHLETRDFRLAKMIERQKRGKA